jgi:hypothetical protein
MPKKLHYIFDSGAPQSPAKPLQDLIVLKKNAAHCRRWVLEPTGEEGQLVVEIDRQGQRLEQFGKLVANEASRSAHHLTAFGY